MRHLMGNETIKMGVVRVFNMFQHKNLNKRLVYVFLEGMLDTLFPQNKFQDIFRKLHSKSSRQKSDYRSSSKESLRSQNSGQPGFRWPDHAPVHVLLTIAAGNRIQRRSLRPHFSPVKCSQLTKLSCASCCGIDPTTGFANGLSAANLGHCLGLLTDFSFLGLSVPWLLNTNKQNCKHSNKKKCSLIYFFFFSFISGKRKKWKGHILRVRKGWEKISTRTIWKKEIMQLWFIFFLFILFLLITSWTQTKKKSVYIEKKNVISKY